MNCSKGLTDIILSYLSLFHSLNNTLPVLSDRILHFFILINSFLWKSHDCLIIVCGDSILNITAYPIILPDLFFILLSFDSLLLFFKNICKENFAIEIQYPHYWSNLIVTIRSIQLPANYHVSNVGERYGRVNLSVSIR